MAVQDLWRLGEKLGRRLSRDRAPAKQVVILLSAVLQRWAEAGPRQEKAAQALMRGIWAAQADLIPQGRPQSEESRAHRRRVQERLLRGQGCPWEVLRPELELARRVDKEARARKPARRKVVKQAQAAAAARKAVKQATVAKRATSGRRELLEPREELQEPREVKRAGPAAKRSGR